MFKMMGITQACHYPPPSIVKTKNMDGRRRWWMAVGVKTKRQDKTWFLQYFTQYLKHTALNYPLVVIVCVCLCARVLVFIVIVSLWISCKTSS